MSIRKKRNSSLNPAFVLTMALSAGTFAAIFIKAAQNVGMPSHLIAAGRMILAAIILSPIVLRKNRSELSHLERRDLMMAMFAGFWLAVHFLTLVTALETTSVMIFMVLVNTSPLWVGLLERVFLSEKLSRTVWMGLLIAISGSVFIAATTGGDNSTGNTLYGIFLSMVAAIANASYLTIGRGLRKKISIFPYVWIVFGFGGLIGMAFVLLTGTPIFGHPAMGYFWLLMLTLIPQLIGHAGFNYALGYFPATLVSLSGQVVTITAAIAAFLFFGEIPTVMQIVGSSIIAFGVAIAILARQR